MTRVLIVSPCFNEEEGILLFIRAIRALPSHPGFAGFTFRLTLVNDGSSDGTLPLILKAQSEDPGFLSVISLAGNFGYQAALTAGLVNVGPWPEVVVTMDSDLEHPPSLIPELVRTWQGGRHLLVNTIRLPANALPPHKRIPSRLYYRCARLLTGLDIQPGQADFRLWDGDFVRALHSHLGNVGSLRLFASWINVPKANVTYDQAVNAARASRFTFKKNIELALSGLIRFSALPMRIMGFAGIAGMALSFLYGAWIIAQAMMGNVIPGWTSIILTIIFMSCVQLLSLGVIALYLKRLVFDRDLPAFLIQKKAGSFE